MTLAVFLLALGCVARITRFINSDVLFAPVRAKVIGHFGIDSKVSDFIECPFCVSIWVGAFVTPAAYYLGHTALFTILAVLLSVSYIYSIASHWLDPEQ